MKKAIYEHEMFRSDNNFIWKDKTMDKDIPTTLQIVADIFSGKYIRLPEKVSAYSWLRVATCVDCHSCDLSSMLSLVK